MPRASSSLGRSSEDGKAYQEAVESFAKSYSDIIEHTNPLVHKMLMHSEGAEPMTKGEIEATIVFISDVKGGGLVVPSAGTEDVQQEGNDGHATYQGSFSRA